MKYIIGIAINPRLEVLLAQITDEYKEEENNYAEYYFDNVIFEYNWEYKYSDGLTYEEDSGTVHAYNSLEEAQKQLIKRLFM